MTLVPPSPSYSPREVKAKSRRFAARVLPGALVLLVLANWASFRARGGAAPGTLPAAGQVRHAGLHVTNRSCRWESEDVVALDALLHLRDRGLQTYWLVRLTTERAELDPAATAVWLRDLPPALDRVEAFATVTRIWARGQPQAAADFALSLAPSAERQAALHAAMSVWLVQSPREASNWCNRLGPGPDLDCVASLIANFSPLVQKSPDVALGWAESIANPDERRQRIATIVGAWAAVDRVGARRYLRSTSALSEFDRNTLTEALPFDW